MWRHEGWGFASILVQSYAASQAMAGANSLISNLTLLVSFDAPALKIGPDRVTYDFGVLINQAAKRLDVFQGERLGTPFV